MVECLSRARRLLGSALQKNKMGGGVHLLVYRTVMSQVWLEKFLPSSRYSWAHKDSGEAVSLPAERELPCGFTIELEDPIGHPA